jgi:2-methylcitrate dehydratase PrpD
MVWALGIAGTQSSGFREMFGTMCKSFHPGRAAQNGLLSAFLAQQNFTSSDRVLEAPRGFAHVMSAARNFEEITADLGEHFEISLNTYKPFACGIVIHPSIDGAVQLRNAYGLQPGDIEKIELRVAPLVLELTGKKRPRTGLEGKFSVYHSVAVALIDGTAGEQQYSDERVANAEVIALRDKVDARVDSNLRDDEAYVTVVRNDGNRLERHVPYSVGSLQRPMSDEQLDTKFRELCRGIIPERQADWVLGLCRRFGTVPDASELALAAAADGSRLVET